MVDEGGVVRPGKVEESRLPPTEEVACIQVNRVYDECVQTLDLTANLTNTGLSGPLTCRVGTPTCTVPNGAVQPTHRRDYRRVLFFIAVPITVQDATGTSLAQTVTGTTSAVLYHPLGTETTCTPTTISCASVVMPDGTLTSSVHIQLLLVTTAVVQLLVPTYGFYQPQPCHDEWDSGDPADLFPPPVADAPQAFERSSEDEEETE
ncbi:MAG: hypothetical protein IMW91_04340 [Firmicutes bacterium]|nr:hypothetical protein [Bacillota bacterium]